MEYSSSVVFFKLLFTADMVSSPVFVSHRGHLDVPGPRARRGSLLSLSGSSAFLSTIEHLLNSVRPRGDLSALGRRQNQSNLCATSMNYCWTRSSMYWLARIWVNERSCSWTTCLLPMWGFGVGGFMSRPWLRINAEAFTPVHVRSSTAVFIAGFSCKSASSLQPDKSLQGDVFGPVQNIQLSEVGRASATVSQCASAILKVIHVRVMLTLLRVFATSGSHNSTSDTLDASLGVLRKWSAHDVCDGINDPRMN